MCIDHQWATIFLCKLYAILTIIIMHLQVIPSIGIQVAINNYQVVAASHQHVKHSNCLHHQHTHT